MITILQKLKKNYLLQQKIISFSINSQALIAKNTKKTKKKYIFVHSSYYLTNFCHASGSLWKVFIRSQVSSIVFFVQTTETRKVIWSGSELCFSFNNNKKKQKKVIFVFYVVFLMFCVCQLQILDIFSTCFNLFQMCSQLLSTFFQLSSTLFHKNLPGQLWNQLCLNFWVWKLRQTWVNVEWMLSDCWATVETLLRPIFPAGICSELNLSPTIPLSVLTKCVSEGISLKSRKILHMSVLRQNVIINFLEVEQKFSTLKMPFYQKQAICRKFQPTPKKIIFV